MQKIVYYVASSLDGFITGPNEDVSLFITEGPGVEQYYADLTQYKTVIMGRKTYEFGYQYGLQPGQPAYPNMEHYVFSNSLEIENTAKSVHIEKPSVDRIQELKANATTDIYLCGGGEFAGWLLDHGLIDVIKLKLNPVILGEGTWLFGSSTTQVKLRLTDETAYPDGMEILTYEMKY